MQKDRVKNAIEMFWEKKVDGILYITSNISDQASESLKELEVPIVLISSKDAQGEFASVTIDDAKAAFQAVDYLCCLGHRKIAYISGKLDGKGAWANRLEGYKAALQAHGIPYQEALVVEGDTRYKSGYLAMKDLMQLPERPTALFAGNDLMAIGAAKAASEDGLRIPEDISLVGFDGIEHTEFFYPPITTIKVQRYDMGAIAMRLLTKFLNNEEVAEKDFVTEVELVERSSCKEV